LMLNSNGKQEAANCHPDPPVADEGLSMPN